MASHVIGTYNMSFMSDLETEIGPKMQFASEGAFLARLYGKPAERRMFWMNAANLLKDFLIEKEPSVVGLQEMNVAEGGSRTGTDAINQIIRATGRPYKQVYGSVPTNNAGLSIIYNPVKIGEYVNHHVLDNPNQGGRPILMLLTQKNDGKKYLSVSMHGAQNPGLRLNETDFNAYMIAYNKQALEKAALKFLSANDLSADTLSGIFIMGDFNDRYDAIKVINICGKEATFTGKPPKSCCYNWDSSCPEEELEEKYKQDEFKNRPYKTCKVPGVDKDPVSGKLTLGDRGAIENYQYAGDKVFGLNPQSEMAIYRPDGKTISEESDHELVYATVGEEITIEEAAADGEAMAGGKRYRGRKTKRHPRKQKKTRKHKKTHKHKKSRKNY
jgi:hypothetical protein